MNNTVTGNCWCLIVTLPEGDHEYKVYIFANVAPTDVVGTHSIFPRTYT